MKPGSCTLPLYGIDAVVLDPMTGEILTDNNVEGVLAIRRPWPGMARTCLNDHPRYLATYLKPYPGYYFTGDGVRRDGDGYLFITGRVDDVLNVSGHRIGTAEVESALVTVSCCFVLETRATKFFSALLSSPLFCIFPFLCLFAQ